MQVKGMRLKYRMIIAGAGVVKGRPEVKKPTSAAEVKRPWLTLVKGEGRIVRAL